MLLPYTAGFNVHRFKDYLPGESLPSIERTLNGVPPAKNEPVHLTFEPGTHALLRRRHYGRADGDRRCCRGPFESVAQEQVLAWLDMGPSTFATPLPERPQMWPRRTIGTARRWFYLAAGKAFWSGAASGLWMSVNELGALTGAPIRSYQGRSDFLPQSLAVQMMTGVWPSVHGLGPRLTGEGAARVFHHGGANDSDRARIEGYLERGDGLSF